MGRLDAKVAIVTAVRGIEAAGGRALASSQDTVDLEDARALMARAHETFGGLHVPVNDAGITSDRSLHNLDDQRWDTVLDVDPRTASDATLAAMPLMMESAKRETADKGTPEHHRKIGVTGGRLGA